MAKTLRAMDGMVNPMVAMVQEAQGHAKLVSKMIPFLNQKEPHVKGNWEKLGGNHTIRKTSHSKAREAAESCGKRTAELRDCLSRNGKESTQAWSKGR